MTNHDEKGLRKGMLENLDILNTDEFQTFHTAAMMVSTSRHSSGEYLERSLIDSKDFQAYSSSENAGEKISEAKYNSLITARKTFTDLRDERMATHKTTLGEKATNALSSLQTRVAQAQSNPPDLIKLTEDDKRELRNKSGNALKDHYSKKTIYLWCNEKFQTSFNQDDEPILTEYLAKKHKHTGYHHKYRGSLYELVINSSEQKFIDPLKEAVKFVCETNLPNKPSQSENAAETAYQNKLREAQSTILDKPISEQKNFTLALKIDQIDNDQLNRVFNALYHPDSANTDKKELLRQDESNKTLCDGSHIKPVITTSQSQLGEERRTLLLGALTHERHDELSAAIKLAKSEIDSNHCQNASFIINNGGRFCYCSMTKESDGYHLTIHNGNLGNAKENTEKVITAALKEGEDNNPSITFTQSGASTQCSSSGCGFAALKMMCDASKMQSPLPPAEQGQMSAQEELCIRKLAAFILCKEKPEDKPIYKLAYQESGKQVEAEVLHRIDTGPLQSETEKLRKSLGWKFDCKNPLVSHNEDIFYDAREKVDWLPDNNRSDHKRTQQYTQKKTHIIHEFTDAQKKKLRTSLKTIKAGTPEDQVRAALIAALQAAKAWGALGVEDFSAILNQFCKRYKSDYQNAMHFANSIIDHGWNTTMLRPVQPHIGFAQKEMLPPITGTSLIYLARKAMSEIKEMPRYKSTETEIVKCPAPLDSKEDITDNIKKGDLIEGPGDFVFKVGPTNDDTLEKKITITKEGSVTTENPNIIDAMVKALVTVHPKGGDLTPTDMLMRQPNLLSHTLTLLSEETKNTGYTWNITLTETAEKSISNSVREDLKNNEAIKISILGKPTLQNNKTAPPKRTGTACAFQAAQQQSNHQNTPPTTSALVS